MKYRNTQEFENIYEVWSKLQGLLDKGTTPVERSGAESSFVSPLAESPICSALGCRRNLSPLAITQYFLTVCVKPSSEILTILPDDLFIDC
jgi:hypothetical protein